MLYHNLNIVKIKFCFGVKFFFLTDLLFYLASFEHQLLKYKQNEKDMFVLFLLVHESKILSLYKPPIAKRSLYHYIHIAIYLGIRGFLHSNS